MHIKIGQFKELFPNASVGLAVHVDNAMREAKINTALRICAFLAQCGHESGGFTIFEENLNYSANALRRVFGKYFTEEQAEEYARDKRRIGSRVYANRMGNGDEASGDGYFYRGRGAIQLTGANNYFAFRKHTGIDVVNNPDWILSMEDLKIKTATWFWQVNNLNRYADEEDFTGLTRRINGGTNGLAHRFEIYQQAQSIIYEPTRSKPGWLKYR